MRLLQNILLVAGTTSLGTIVTFLGIAFLVSLLQSPGGEPWTRGFGQYIGGLVLAPLGALVGLLIGIGWIRARQTHQTWGQVQWLGILVGLVVGWAAVSYWEQHGGLDHWLCTALVVAASCTIGGAIACAIKLPLMNSKPGKKSKLR